jgi:hypothetical protein
MCSNTLFIGTQMCHTLYINEKHMCSNTLFIETQMRHTLHINEKQMCSNTLFIETQMCHTLHINEKQMCCNTLLIEKKMSNNTLCIEEQMCSYNYSMKNRCGAAIHTPLIKKRCAIIHFSLRNRDAAINVLLARAFLMYAAKVVLPAGVKATITSAMLFIVLVHFLS